MSARRVLAFVALLAGLHPVAPLRAAVQEAAEPEASERRADLIIDTSRVGEAGPVIKRRIEERGGIVLREAGVLPAEDGRDPRISVSVEELRGEDPGYVFELFIEQDGEVVGERRRVECTLCTESEIVARVEDTLATALAELPEPASEPASLPPPELAEAPSEGSGSASASGPRDRTGLGTKGKAGVGLLVAGVVGMGAGVGLVVPSPRVRRSDPRTVTDTRPPGIAVLASGAAVAVVGAVLLGLDRRQRRSTVAVLPWPGHAGASVMLRF